MIIKTLRCVSPAWIWTDIKEYKYDICQCDDGYKNAFQDLTDRRTIYICKCCSIVICTNCYNARPQKYTHG